MGRYKTIGQCVVVALLTSGFAAASALASEAPEFGRCVKKATHEGVGFSDSKCVHGVSTGAKFEWVPGPGAKAGFTTVERFAFSKKHRQCSLGLSEEGLAKEDLAAAEKASEPEKAKLIKAAEEHEAVAAEHFASAKLTSEACAKLLKTEEPKVPVALETVGGKRMICGGSSGTGDYSGPKTLDNVKFTFTECELVGVPFECSSDGASEGEVLTTTLDGTLGVIGKPEVGAKGVYGIDYAPASGSVVAEFKCGSFAFKVSGSVIREVKAGKALKSEKFKFSEGHGRQNPESFEGEPKDVLMAEVTGTAKEEQAGLVLRGLLSNEEAIEVNPAF
jgi:hypothetical protein